jgi:uncharacterized protein
MKSAIEREDRSFTLVGGEKLLLPERYLEDLWSWGFQRCGNNFVQTNGIALREAHLRMFKQYNVQAGISMDGPEELNELRWAGSPQRISEATAKTAAAIERLLAQGHRSHADRHFASHQYRRIAAGPTAGVAGNSRCPRGGLRQPAHSRD